jgi:hypothetical protein
MVDEDKLRKVASREGAAIGNAVGGDAIHEVAHRNARVHRCEGAATGRGFAKSRAAVRGSARMRSAKARPAKAWTVEA